MHFSVGAGVALFAGHSGLVVRAPVRADPAAVDRYVGGALLLPLPRAYCRYLGSIRSSPVLGQDERMAIARA